jgi:hypothetical protein
MPPSSFATLQIRIISISLPAAAVKRIRAGPYLRSGALDARGSFMHTVGLGIVEKEVTMRRSAVVTLAMGVLWVAVGSAFGQEERTAASPRKTREVDEATQRWMAAITPGEPHRLLDKFIGTWYVTTRAWTEGPESKPKESMGLATYEWILRGHYVLEETQGQVMGFPLEGRGITGYDNVRQQYVGTWIDNMSTAIYTMSGTLDTTGTVLTLFGPSDDPRTGEMDKTMKYVTRFVDEDHFVFEIYDTSLGDDGKVVEMLYDRK